MVAVVLALVVAGCSSNGDDGASSADQVNEPQTGLGGTGSGDDAGGPTSDEDSGDTGGEGGGRPPGDLSGPGVEPVVLAQVDLGRSIIYTATIDIQTDDVAAASRAAQQAIAGLGGVVFGQDTTSDPRPRTVLVFKVQPADFGEAMQRLEGIGTVVAQDISADDVTDRVVDLQSRILTSEVSVERLRGLLQNAASVEAIAALEGQLLERETNLELLRGQLRTLQSQVSLATITVTISQEAAEATAEVEVTAYDGDDEGDRCPGERRLEVDEGESVVLCIAVTNAGNVGLGEIEVRDLGLDLRRDDFTLIDFGPDDVLAPGETVIAWATFDAERNSTPRPNVSTVPVDESGLTLRTTTQMTEEAVELGVVPDDSLPGFGDSLGAGWGALQRVVGVAIVVVGALAPFLLVGVPAAAAIVWWRRRDEEVLVDDEASGAATPA